MHSDDILEENSPLTRPRQRVRSSMRKRKHYKEEDNEKDGLNSFFACMERTTRKLTPDLQLKVKRMVSDIVFDEEERWLRDQNIIS